MADEFDAFLDGEAESFSPTETSQPGISQPEVKGAESFNVANSTFTEQQDEFDKFLDDESQNFLGNDPETDSFLGRFQEGVSDFLFEQSGRVKAGFLGEESPLNEPGLDIGDISELIGDVGPLLGGFAGAGPAGALAARATQNVARQISRVSKGEEPISVAEAIIDPPLQVGLQVFGEKVVGAVGAKVVQAAKPALVKNLSRMIQALSGIPEKEAAAALNDLTLLGGAKSVNEVGELMNTMFEKASISGGGAGFKIVTGTRFTSVGKAIKLMESSLDDLLDNKLTLQKAVSARQAISNALKTTPNPKTAMNRREMVIGLNHMDDFIEPQLPGYREIRRAFRNAKIAENFGSLLPLNKNLSPNVLRTLLSLGLASGGAAERSPMMALAAPAFSPFFQSLGIRGAGATVRVAPAATRAGVAVARPESQEFLPALQQPPRSIDDR